MAKPKVSKNTPKEKSTSSLKKPAVKEIFTSKNRTLMAIGIFILIIGYIALALGSITLAPILLVGAYCVIIPIAIVVKNNKEKKRLRKTESREAS